MHFGMHVPKQVIPLFQRANQSSMFFFPRKIKRTNPKNLEWVEFPQRKWQKMMITLLEMDFA